MELVVIILFFAITSAVCVNLFVGAHLTSVASKDLNKAVVQVQTAAETVKNAQGDREKLALRLGAVQQGEALAVYYDKDWNPTTQAEQAGYQLQVTQTLSADGILYADVAMNKGEELLYYVKVSSYIG